jgi:hypothetical protein
MEASKEPVRVQLMDMMGKSFFEEILSSEDYKDGIQITPREQLSNGIYIVMIHQGTRTRRQTLIVKD